MPATVSISNTIKRLTWYRLLRRIRKIRDRREFSGHVGPYDLVGQNACDRIREMLMSPDPCMISRFGNNEMRTVMNFLSVRSTEGYWTKLSKYLNGQMDPWWWDDRTAREMVRGAGFFPATPETLERFAKMTIADCPQIDLLGAWLPGERELAELMRPVRIPILDLDPYRHVNPWTRALEGKRVLVIHPFARTIESQYSKRELLFSDPRILPSFQLLTFRAVQSIGGDCTGYSNWFEALEWMKDNIARLSFEIAVIGAGAYGMPLAAFIKRDMGRKAIHLGGATQILFGIKGRRYDHQPPYCDLYNEHWVRPSNEETPAKANRVEGGCYW